MEKSEAKIIKCENQIYIVGERNGNVWMFDQDGLWFSSTGINGTYTQVSGLHSITVEHLDVDGILEKAFNEKMEAK